MIFFIIAQALLSQAEYDSVDREYRLINFEISEIKENYKSISEDQKIRHDEINVLRMRHSSITLDDSSLPNDMINSLVSLRKILAARLLPTAKAKMEESRIAMCKARDAVILERKEREKSIEYITLPIKERMAIQKRYDESLASSDDCENIK